MIHEPPEGVRKSWPSLESTDEFFEAVAQLTAELEMHGHADAAAELRSGFGCLNGLTDGWALFLESIDKVQAPSEAIRRRRAGGIGNDPNGGLFRGVSTVGLASRAV